MKKYVALTTLWSKSLDQYIVPGEIVPVMTPEAAEILLEMNAIALVSDEPEITPELEDELEDE